MGKKRKQGGASGRPKPQLDSDEEAQRMADPDPKSRSFMFDEIDEFHENNQKILLQSAKKYESHQVDSDEEEVFGLDLSSEEDDIEEKLTQFQIHQQKDQMDSDIDDDDDDRVPDDKAWGRYKSVYYDTDYVDKGHRNKTQDENELAEAEEVEAKALQQRLAGELDDQDFDLDLFMVARKAPEVKENNEQVEQVVEKDLSKLSKQEKIELVKRESPELLVLLEDLKKMITETRGSLLPLVSLIENGVIADGPAAIYLKTKYHVLINYFTNACFYVMLKVKRTSLTNHPIISRLVSYRKMIQELYTIDEVLQDEVDKILKCINRGGDVDRVLLAIGRKGQPLKSSKKQLGILRKKPPADVESADVDHREKRVSFTAEKKLKGSGATKLKRPAASDEDAIDEDESLTPLKKAKRLKSLKDSTTKGVVAAEEPTSVDQEETWKLSARELKTIGDGIHQARKKASEKLQEAKKGLLAKTTDEQETDITVPEDYDMSLDDKSTSKRPINFQISKNKGLTPYRKKEDANPRVKYRKKFQKAVSRRKGQVREVKREDKRYGGESAGIRAGTSRSVKFK